MDGMPLLSPDWYRVAYLRPRLRPGVRVTRQSLRGETWYVLSDPLSGRHHRFNAIAYGLIASCDGRRTIDEAWARRCDAEGDDAPTQAQAIEVFAQAFAANLFAGDVAPDARAVLRMQDRRRTQRRRSALNPLSFRVPLWNPQPLLEAQVDRVRWLFGRLAWRVMLGVLALGAALLLWNIAAFFEFARANVGSGRLLIAMWAAYPLIKALHELAHAFAVKVHGGEVHEMGVTLLLLTPVPYVDASASIAFADKRRRMAVAGAGIVAEALVATAALGLWLLLEPGLARDLAFAVAFIGGVSTVVVNGNPLLRFDGYHFLCDALELPNLALRSARHWQHLLKRRVLGLRRLRPLPLARGEAGWLLAYAPLSWAYRTVLLVGLALTVADWNALAGLAVLALAVWVTAAKPLTGLLQWLGRDQELQGRRTRAVMTVGIAATLGVTVVFALPVPLRTSAPGVVWLPETALVRPQTDGFVAELLVHDGQQVEAGTPLLRLTNDPLRLELARLEAQVREHEVASHSAFEIDAVRARQAADRMRKAQAERDRAAQRVAALEVRAGVAGRVALDERRLRMGQYLPQGEIAAHVLPTEAPLVRALVANDDIALVREVPGEVAVELAHAGGTSLPAVLERAVPQASTLLPTPALGEPAGGPVAVDPRDTSGRTAAEPRFEVDLRLPSGAQAFIGARAMVTFRHGESTLAALLNRSLRRAFLRHFEQ